MWYLRVSNPETVATTNCFHFTDSQTYELCVEGGAIVFTDAPDSHYTIDKFMENTVTNLTVQIATLEDSIRKMQNTVHATTHPINIIIHRLTPRDPLDP